MTVLVTILCRILTALFLCSGVCCEYLIVILMKTSPWMSFYHFQASLSIFGSSPSFGPRHSSATPNSTASSLTSSPCNTHHFCIYSPRVLGFLDRKGQSPASSEALGTGSREMDRVQGEEICITGLWTGDSVKDLAYDQSK